MGTLPRAFFFLNKMAPIFPDAGAGRTSSLAVTKRWAQVGGPKPGPCGWAQAGPKWVGPSWAQVGGPKLGPSQKFGTPPPPKKKISKSKSVLPKMSARSGLVGKNPPGPMWAHLGPFFAWAGKIKKIYIILFYFPWWAHGPYSPGLGQTMAWLT